MQRPQSPPTKTVAYQHKVLQSALLQKALLGTGTLENHKGLSVVKLSRHFCDGASLASRDLEPDYLEILLDQDRGPWRHRTLERFFKRPHLRHLTEND